MRIRIDIPSHSEEVILHVKTNLHPRKLFEAIFDEVVKNNILEEDDRRYFKKLNYYIYINNIITAKELFKDRYSIEDNQFTINSLGIRNIKYFSLVLATTTTTNESGKMLPNLKGKETVTKKFSKEAPDWRIVYQGFNLEGICDYKDCDAHSKRVLNVANEGTSRGYGKFNIFMYLNQKKFLCPNCKHDVLEITNFYFRNCEFEWTGEIRKSSGERETLSQKGIAPKDVDMLTFKFEDLEKEKLEFFTYDFNITKLDS